jgi:hypothetical protein
MSIQEFGALGEGIGSLLILVTLIYLAVQNKYQQKLLLSHAYQSRTDTSIKLMEWMITNSSVASRAVKAMNREELSPVETQQEISHTIAMLRMIDNNHFQHSIGVLSADQLGSLKENAIMAFQHSNGATYWPTIRTVFRDSFAIWVDEIIQEMEQEETAA